MYHVVLTAAGGVSDDAARAVLAETGGALTRLSDRAVDLAVAAVPRVPEINGVDVNIVPAAGREKRLLIADMDSTIIAVECIDELADFVGKKPEVAAITERAMQGELDFEGALDARVALLKGITRDQIAACFAERVVVNPGARTLVQTMNARGAMTALVSGGFTVFTSPVSEVVGFAVQKANTLNFAGEALDGTVARPIVDAATKLSVLKALSQEAGIGTEAALAVGDGANDAEMVRAAGLGVAYRAKPKLRAVADAVLDHSDLSALLSLQGIPERAFKA